MIGSGAFADEATVVDNIQGPEGGKLLKIPLRGKLLHEFDIAAGDGVTNVAFGPDERDLYVTVVKDPNDPRFKGKIVRIPNAGRRRGWDASAGAVAMGGATGAPLLVATSIGQAPRRGYSLAAGTAARRAGAEEP